MRRLILVLVALAALAAAVAGFYYARVDERYQGFEGTEQFVEITPGSGSRAIGRALAQAGVVRDEWTFRMAVYLTGTARELKAGEYRFAGPASPKEIARKLARGAVYLRPVTFPEGLTVKEMARVFESRGLGTAKAFVEAAANPGAIQRDSTRGARDLEGYCFPRRTTSPGARRASDTGRADGGAIPGGVRWRRFVPRRKPRAGPCATSSRSRRSWRRKPPAPRSAP